MGLSGRGELEARGREESRIRLRKRLETGSRGVHGRRERRGIARGKGAERRKGRCGWTGEGEFMKGSAALAILRLRRAQAWGGRDGERGERRQRGQGRRCTSGQRKRRSGLGRGFCVAFGNVAKRYFLIGSLELRRSSIGRVHKESLSEEVSEIWRMGKKGDKFREIPDSDGKMGGDPAQWRNRRTERHF